MFATFSALPGAQDSFNVCQRREIALPLCCGDLWDAGAMGGGGGGVGVSVLLGAAAVAHFFGKEKLPPPKTSSKGVRTEQRFEGRLEEVAKAVGGGHCRLQMPLRLALGVRGGGGGQWLGIGGALWRGGTPPCFQYIADAKRKKEISSLPKHVKHLTGLNRTWGSAYLSARRTFGRPIGLIRHPPLVLAEKMAGGTAVPSTGRKSGRKYGRTSGRPSRPISSIRHPPL